ncbi:elongation factor 2 [Heterostelium album PN500]|uniref:Elongation factor 2 n=1 Tax=Heterostelium pallidum (strain ATCC 26659 / Pp 5 / PN500) TaxID=670386 RepID=D3BIN1_HETP5|nr:elongation factor 2 [Heterostelium album PN500]EFA78655.1 elongation factor 2 [Heterostelium album PN500]|eukprot:XP_020430779.1 elongation factor 2 [Heterostelium album PN500]
MYGVRFDMSDITLIADGAHRRVAQIMPASRKVLYAAELSAQPRLLEPMYLVDIQAPSRVLKGVHKCLNRRRGVTISEEEKLGMNGVFSIRAHLPVSESFGFSAYLQSETSGLAFLQMSFDHWSMMSQDPLEPNSVTNKIVQDIRVRKGLRQEIPPLNEFLDRL